MWVLLEHALRPSFDRCARNVEAHRPPDSPKRHRSSPAACPPTCSKNVNIRKGGGGALVTVCDSMKTRILRDVEPLRRIWTLKGEVINKSAEAAVPFVGHMIIPDGIIAW